MIQNCYENATKREKQKLSQVYWCEKKIQEENKDNNQNKSLF